MTMRIPGLVVPILGLSLFLAACDTSMEPTSKPPVQAELNVPFSLSAGQTAVLAQEKLSVKFVGVIEDTRCRIDMECISAGDATMVVQAEEDGKPSMILSLTLYGGPQGVAYETFAIHVKQLMPYPVSTRAIHSGDYRVSLLVDRP
jgi:hypothetical protein